MNNNLTDRSQRLSRVAMTLLLAGLPMFYAYADFVAAPAVAPVTQQPQQNVATGIVTDEKGEPLIGVTVIIEGQSGTGTVTDLDGRFELRGVSRGVKIQLSYIGYAPQTVTWNGQSINIKLEPENTTIGEVVVTAMGIRRKEESLTYATQQVRASDLNRVQDANLANSLEGKVAGITITPSAGGAGGASKIILRGNKSILGSSTPLIVVDGVPMTNSQHGQISSDSFMSEGHTEGADALSMINPEDIESINVLKGANAAALYGSVAANGVLMITTKKGREGKMRIDLSSNITFDSPLTKPKIQNIYGATVRENNIAGQVSDYSWGPRLADRSSDKLTQRTPMDGDTFKYTVIDDNGQTKTIRQYNDVHLRNYAADDIDDFFRTGVTTNNSLALSGGTENMSSYFSYGNAHSNGMMRNNSYNRNTLSFRQMFKFFNRATVNISMNYISTKTKNRPGGGTNMNPIFDMYTMPRNIDMAYYRDNYRIEKGRWNAINQSYFERQNNGTYKRTTQNVALTGPMMNWYTYSNNHNNPYWLMYQNESVQREDRFFGNITGSLDIWDGLSFQARLGIDFDKYESETKRYATTYVPSGIEPYGRYFWSNNRTTEFYTDYMLNYNKTFRDTWDVSATAGFVGHTIKGYNKSVDTGNATYIDPQNVYLSDLINWFSVSAGGAGKNSQSRSSNWDKGAVFTAQIGWKEKVYIDGSYRRDWYRAFKQFKDRGTPVSYGYFGFGANAIISSLVKLPEWWNYLKYRVSYSEVGNSIPNQVFGAVNINWRDKTYTPNIWADFKDPRPEKTQSFETGFETTFLNDRLSIDFTYYNSTTSNLYMVGTNASGRRIPMNSAKIRNQGIETSIGYNWKIMRNMTWKTTVNFAYNKNKILRTAYSIDETTGKEKENVIATNVGLVQVLYKEGGSVGDMYISDIRRYEQDGVDDKGNPVKAGWYQLDSKGGVQTVADSDKKLKKYVGNMNAPWTLGWSNQFTWKDFTLTFLINGRIGGKVLSFTEAMLDAYGVSQRTADARMYAEQHNIYATNYGDGKQLGIELDDGSGRIVPLEEYYQSVGGNNPQDLQRYIYNGTNFRLRELTLGYTFRNLFGANRNLALSFIARNLFFIYKDAPVDPDVSLATGNGLGAFEMFNMPSARSFGFSLNMNF